ncbi:MAG TPA: adenylate/guanylate cyclase domain-containing protein [Candidatus Tectomicrobia bacterium]
MKPPRFTRALVIFGGLVCGVVATLAFLAITTTLRERAAIRHSALTEGYWIVKALEVSHGMMQPGHAEAMRTLLRGLQNHHGLRSLLLLDDRQQVLLASEPTREGTRWTGALTLPREHGRIIADVPTHMVLVFPVSFAATASPSQDVLPRITWIILELDMSEASAHYTTVVRQAVFVVLSAVLLGCIAFFFLGTMQKYTLARASITRLEQITSHLARFVPETVHRLIEANPAQPTFDKVMREATILFLDIARYTQISQELSPDALNRLIETYFAAFLDHILAHGGEINETAGDGVMAIFTAPTRRAHARNAVQAALAIQAHTHALNQARTPHALPIQVNIGINTGPVLLGVTRIRGAAGERFTYTASGDVTNLAARLCALGHSGEIHLSQTTAQYVPTHVEVQGPYATHLKHIQDPVLVYTIDAHASDSNVRGDTDADSTHSAGPGHAAHRDPYCKGQATAREKAIC